MNLDYVILWVSLNNNNDIYTVKLKKFDTIKSLLTKCCKKFKLNPLYHSLYTKNYEISYNYFNNKYSDNYKLITNNNLNNLFKIYSAKYIYIKSNYTDYQFKIIANKGRNIFIKYI